MAKYITLYNKIKGTDDILEKYIPTDEYKNLYNNCKTIETMNTNYFFTNNPVYTKYGLNYLPAFKNFDYGETYTMEFLWNLKFYIYESYPILDDDYTQKFTQLFLAQKKYIEDNNLDIYKLNKYMLEVTDTIFAYFLLKLVIKIEFPKKYIVAGPGNNFNQIIPLFIINDINNNNAKWQIIIFGYNDITNDEIASWGNIGDNVKEYIKTKISKDKIKNLDIIAIDHGYSYNRGMEVSYLFLPFIESQFEKLIFNDTLGRGENQKSTLIDYNIIKYIIPDILETYVNTNKIIFYNNSYGFGVDYYNKELLEWKFYQIFNYNCNKNYLKKINDEYDAKCVLDSVPLDIVLNNGFSILDTEKSKKGGYYKKYLKYKMKYISLKNKYMTRL
jgi:hypothetical protein